MTGVQTCALPICSPTTRSASLVSFISSTSLSISSQYDDWVVKRRLNCSLALNGLFCFPEVIVEKVLLSLNKRTCGLFVAYLAVFPVNRTTCQGDDKTVSSLIQCTLSWFFAGYPSTQGVQGLGQRCGRSI